MNSPMAQVCYPRPLRRPIEMRNRKMTFNEISEKEIEDDFKKKGDSNEKCNEEIIKILCSSPIMKEKKNRIKRCVNPFDKNIIMNQCEDEKSI